MDSNGTCKKIGSYTDESLFNDTIIPKFYDEGDTYSLVQMYFTYDENGKLMPKNHSRYENYLYILV